jgi:hypothetical protein
MPTEVSKTLNARLYPDLQQAGGLGPALQQALEELGTMLRVHEMDEPFIVYAAVRTAERSSQVMVAADQRAFHVDFWKQGVQYGSGWTSDLREVAQTAVAFHLENENIVEIAARFAWLKVDPHVASHERGAEFFVAERWHDLENWVASDQFFHLRKLLPLVVEAAKRPELRQLMPFTSMNRLCFSRTTGYPYSYDCPSAWALEGGLFRIVAADQETVVGEGNAVRAADLLVASLPQNCGPAIHGTAKDLNGSFRD